MEINHVIKIESWEQKHFFLYYPDESHEQLLYKSHQISPNESLHG